MQKKYFHFKYIVLQNFTLFFLFTLSFFILLLSCKSNENIINNSESSDKNAVDKNIVTQPSELKISFEDWKDGDVYSKTMAIQDLKSLKFWDSNPTLSIKKYDDKNNYQGLRVKFPKDNFGGQSGVIAETILAERNEYTLEFKVFFEPEFQFSKDNSQKIYGGGKLLGLCGGSRPSGGNKKEDGMSARIMFRKDPTQKTSQTGGYLELYHYWRGQKGIYGDQLYLQNCESGNWYTIKMRVNIGSSNTDGNLKVWMNGTEKINKSFRYLANDANWKLKGVMFHSFYGGNTEEWAPSDDTYLILDNIKVDDDAF